jgi:hypothetical protein
MARRGLWVIGGVAAGVGALVAVPGASLWLRRRLGLAAEDRRWFEEEGGAEPAEHEGDEPLDTREARFSLRARLSEDGHGTAVEDAEALPGPPPFSTWPSAPEPLAEELAPALDDPPATAFGEPAPVAEEPQATPFEEPAPAPDEPAPVSGDPAPAPEYLSYESVPAVTPEADAPRAPGEDTNEIEPLPPVSTWAPPSAQPPAPPEEQQPPAPPEELQPPSRPFSRPFRGEGASFRSAIDAARERVHGAAREATPDEGEDSESRDESS